MRHLDRYREAGLREDATRVGDTRGMAATGGIQPELVLPPPDELVGRKSSGQQASLYIRRIVFDGVLHPGDRVPQDAIAYHLGLSRVPVREALLALQREGWVRITPHRGAFISTLDEEVVRDHYELFGHIYSLASARAARRRTDENVAELVRLEGELQAAEDAQKAWRANMTFQRALIDIARSPRVHALLGVLTDIVPGNFFQLVPGALELEKQGTARVVRAIRRGDADASASEYASLMQRQGELVVRLFASRGLLHGPEKNPG
jgi:DNA-binding GntR family transcriptional regulator